MILIIDEEEIDHNDGDVDKTGGEGECFPLAASLNGQCLADNDDDNVDDDDDNFGDDDDNFGDDDDNKNDEMMTTMMTTIMMVRLIM